MAARFNEPRRSSDSSRCFPRRRHLLARTYTLASAAAPAHWPRAAGRGEAGRAEHALRRRGRQVGVRGGSRPGADSEPAALSGCGPARRGPGAPGSGCGAGGERTVDGGDNAKAPGRPGFLTSREATWMAGGTRDVRSPGAAA